MLEVLDYSSITYLALSKCMYDENMVKSHPMQSILFN